MTRMTMHLQSRLYPSVCVFTSSSGGEYSFYACISFYVHLLAHLVLFCVGRFPLCFFVPGLTGARYLPLYFERIRVCSLLVFLLLLFQNFSASKYPQVFRRRFQDQGVGGSSTVDLSGLWVQESVQVCDVGGNICFSVCNVLPMLCC